jgi:hypothetical protein
MDKKTITRVNKILSSCKDQAELYTQIGYDIYKLEHFKCDVAQKKIRFKCEELNTMFSDERFKSFETEADGNNIASIPNDQSESFEIDFWKNLSFRELKSSGGRRKKSRAKKSRKNRRTRNRRS